MLQNGNGEWRRLHNTYVFFIHKKRRGFIWTLDWEWMGAKMDKDNKRKLERTKNPHSKKGGFCSLPTLLLFLR
jgi:hypothetical protein